MHPIEHNKSSGNTGLLLSVVMPAYNEEKLIEDTIAEIAQHVLGAIESSELIVVNDGSTDQTGDILERLAEEEPRIRIIHQDNSGHGPALIRGLDSAKGEYLFMVDSDAQIPLAYFKPLWEQAQHRDGTFGIRKNRKDPLLRIILSRGVQAAIYLLFRVRTRDANIPFKIIRRSIWLEAREYIPTNASTPSIYIAIFAKRHRLEVVEHEVPHRERATGKSSLRNLKLIKFCAFAFMDLLAFRRRIM